MFKIIGTLTYEFIKICLVSLIVLTALYTGWRIFGDFYSHTFCDLFKKIESNRYHKSIPVAVTFISSMSDPTVKIDEKYTNPLTIFKANYDHYMKSTVMISGTENMGICDNEDPSHNCHGSGVVIAVDHAAKKTLIMTNKHVVANDATLNCKVWVYFYNEVEGHEGSIVYVGVKTGHDLALIMVDGEYEAVPISTKPAELFDDVFNVNVARCIRNLISIGKVVQLDREVLGKPSDTLALWIDGGASGSPVYNTDGQLVGLIFAQTLVRMPVSHMIRLQTIKEFLTDYGQITFKP